MARLLMTVFYLATLLSPLSAQTRDSVSTLEPLVVTVTRGSGRSVLGSPFAITIVTPDSARPGQRRAAADETLALIPGLTATNRTNPSQDPRLSIRGFGARSAFGVRGIRVLRDGMPITLPDGQTPLDYISLESVETVEILRGAASALYGNASGGVIDFRTRAPSPSPFSLEARQWLGSNDALRSVAAFSGTIGATGYVGDVARYSSDGVRNHSSQLATSGFARVSANAGANNIAVTALALDNPRAQNPGALTLDEMRDDPRLADAPSVRRNARKAVTQAQFGVSASRAGKASEFSIAAFGGARSLDNPLTFAVVEVGRHSWGGSASARTRGKVGGAANSLTLGVDFQSQNDLRRNFFVCADTIPATVPTANCPVPGDDRGIVTLDQRELISSIGLYASDEVSLSDRITVVGGLRGDRVRFEVQDRLISQSNPDDSGDRVLTAISPVAGVVARLSRSQSVYANISTAFETPTATELGNREDGSAGINPELDPQRSYTIEAGAKGWITGPLRYDIALFDTRVRDELVPFEIPASNGRRFFRNAGRTKRRGGEAGFELIHPLASVLASYSYSDFRFVDYRTSARDFGGKRIPGIPRHRFQGAVRFGPRSVFGIVENETAGRSFTDDANTVEAPGYSVTSFRGGGMIRRGSLGGSITAGIQNVFDRTYAASIAVNAAREKFFEPAPGRSFFVGITIGAEAGR